MLVFICIMSVSSLAVKYQIINYQTSDGLPQNQVNALIQDHLGYIYVGTQVGIGRFNGFQFETITKKDGLSHNFINDLALDAQGNIWVATQEGLSRISPDGKIKNLLPRENIPFIIFDNHTNTLWIISLNKIYYLKDETPLQYINPIFEDQSESIMGMAITPAGDKYFYSNHKIFSIPKEAPPQVIQSNLLINSIKWLNYSQRLVICTQDGLFTLENNLQEEYIPLPQECRRAVDIVEDNKGRTWVGTRNGLLFYATPTDIPEIIDDKNGMDTKEINTILIDREKNLFVGTEWGLSQIFPNLFKMYHEADGLPHKFVWSFTEDIDNDSIILSCNNGLAELKNNIITPFSEINPHLINFSIRTVTPLGNSNFLLGTRFNGIYKWDRKNKLEKLHDAHVFSALKTHDNIIWFGTDNGLLKFDHGRFTLFQEKIKDKYIWDIDKLDDDTLLLGTEKGVQVFHKEKIIPSEIERKLNDVLINDIGVVSRNEILVATEADGLYIYRFDTHQITHINKSNGLLSNSIWSAIKDNSGNIWINTSVSLDRYTDGFISHFNKETGLIGEEGTVHSAFKTSSGKVYISIIPGFIEIPPTYKEDLDIQKPILFIKGMKLKGEKINIDTPTPLHFKYNQNSVEFNYIAISTRKENPIFYKIRLTPLEKEWSSPTQETEIKYLNLSPARYTFEVIANNGGGVDQWFTANNKIFFTIESPFWLTWWFILLAIVFGALIVLLIIKIRINALEHQTKILERLVEERTIELGQRNKELAYLSVTDPLTDLKNRRYLEEKIKEDIGLIQRNVYYNLNHSNHQPLNVPILGVFILDIDYFKQVNDNYGHKAGDIVIVDIARLLLEMLRHSDTIVRWGGEEFLIITRQSIVDGSFELAERIRKKIEDFEFRVDECITIRKTVSVGFAHFPFIKNNTANVNWTQVVSLADSALFIAKNNGRNMSVGLEWGARKLDIDFKEIVSNVKMGIEKKYLKIISPNKDKLKVAQHKAESHR